MNAVIMHRKGIAVLLIVLLIATGIPLLAEAAQASDGSGYTVVAKRNAKIKYKWGGYVTSITTGKSKSPKRTYTGAQTFTITTYAGFTLHDVVVDGVSKGKIDTYTFPASTKGDHTIYAKFRRTGTFVTIDPGHQGKHNAGLYGYYEGEQMWKLGTYLKEALAERGVVVKMTRSKGTDPSLRSRGRAAKGTDLFVSLHSNYSSSATPDYTVSLCCSETNLRYAATPLAKKLAKQIKTTMGTKQSPQVWHKALGKTKISWFGVVRNAAAVKVPGMILEHSFHSNKAAAKWLLKNANLKELAEKEADVIVEHMNTPLVPGKMKAVGKKKSVKVSWRQSTGASGYKVYRASKKDGTYKCIKIISGNHITTYKQKKLTKGKIYYYKVRAFRDRADGTREYSSTLTEAKADPAKVR